MIKIGVKHCVRVSMSAFTASTCHRCWSTGSSLGQGFSLWQFLKLIVRGFLPVLRCPPLFHPSMVSAKEINVKVNVISTQSDLTAELFLCTMWHTICST